MDTELTVMMPSQAAASRARARKVTWLSLATVALIASTLLPTNVEASTSYPYTIFGSPFSAAGIPLNRATDDPNPVEVGVKFRTEIGGSVTGVRFFKGPGNTGTHVGNLWTGAGTPLTSATFSNETDSGWQQVNFSSAVSINPNTTYVASYHTNSGHYAADSGYFSSSGVDNPPLPAGLTGPTGFSPTAPAVLFRIAASATPTTGWTSYSPPPEPRRPPSPPDSPHRAAAGSS